MSIPEQCRFISLDEIDENIIAKVRDVNEFSDSFRILTNSIREDYQRHPIILRALTNSEKSSAKQGALYGIIDGHHRFRVARNLNHSSISAIVIKNSDATTSDTLHDLKLALRLNEASSKMSLLDKGKILYDLMNKTGRDATELAEKLFGIRTSMTYRCLNAYRKSIGENVITKPRKSVEFKITSLKSAWKEIAKYKDIPSTITDSADCFIAITKLESLLRRYKNLLNEQHNLTEEIEKRKTTEKK